MRVQRIRRAALGVVVAALLAGALQAPAPAMPVGTPLFSYSPNQMLLVGGGKLAALTTQGVSIIGSDGTQLAFFAEDSVAYPTIGSDGPYVFFPRFSTNRISKIDTSLNPPQIVGTYDVSAKLQSPTHVTVVDGKVYMIGYYPGAGSRVAVMNEDGTGLEDTEITASGTYVGAIFAAPQAPGKLLVGESYAYDLYDVTTTPATQLWSHPYPSGFAFLANVAISWNGESFFVLGGYGDDVYREISMATGDETGTTLPGNGVMATSAATNRIAISTTAGLSVYEPGSAVPSWTYPGDYPEYLGMPVWDASGTSLYAASSFSLYRVYPDRSIAEISLSPPGGDKRFDFGTPVQLTANLGTGPPGAQVRILSGWINITETSTVATGPFDGSGAFTATVEPQHHESCYSAAFDGDVNWNSAASNGFCLTIDPWLEASIVNGGSRNRFHPGDKVVYVAKMHPAVPKYPLSVELQVKIHGGWRAVDYAKVKMDKAGAIRLPFWLIGWPHIHARLDTQFKHHGEWATTTSSFTYFTVA